MRPGPCLLLLFALSACSAVERDIKLATIMEDLKDVAYGGDRGLWNYRAEIQAAATRSSGPYDYRPPVHLSQYHIDRAVHGLGGTEVDDAEQLAQVVDVLFQVVRNDPTPVVRRNAVSQLGRVVLRLPLDPKRALPPDPVGEERIHAIVQDLFTLNQKLAKGERVKTGEVLTLMKQLTEVYPPRSHTAIELVRSLSLPPIAGSAAGKVREYREQIAPAMIRDSILVMLREMACGHTVTRTLPDPAPMVRAEAADVLARLAVPVAVDSALTRLEGEFDPPERDTEVRARLVRYLGEMGGPRAFDACLVRLGEPHLTVRYHAQRALVRMTGVRKLRTVEQWSAWRAKRPKWQLKKPAPADE